MSILNDSVNHWFAVQVWSGREQRCAAQLRLRGYEVFLPTCCEHRRWSDRVKKIERAVFAGYVFCRLNGDAAGKLVTTPGIIRIVGDGRGPLPIPTHEIETIQRIVTTGLAATPWPYVQVGQRVRIDIGPLRDIEGLVLRTSQGQRLLVSITLLQRSVAVEIDADWVSIPPEALFGSDAVTPPTLNYT
jgi:transcription termination/antitermination protein NusG